MTEDLIDSLSKFEDSLQYVGMLEAAGHRLDTFISLQFLRALRFESVETTASFPQREDDTTSAAASVSKSPEDSDRSCPQSPWLSFSAR